MPQETMLLSRICIRNTDVSSFRELIDIIQNTNFEGNCLLEIDIKPDYPDTPRNWEPLIEEAFTWSGKKSC